eukprot:scaffold52_cov109-Isochrysis_galbana.AAC.3
MATAPSSACERAPNQARHAVRLLALSLSLLVLRSWRLEAETGVLAWQVAGADSRLRVNG